MSDNKGCSSSHESVHTVLNDLLSSGIDGGCSLIKDKYRRICYSCSCNCKKLSLTLGKVCTVSCEHCVIAIRKSLNETVGIGELSCCLNLFISCIEFTVSDVLHNRSRKEMRILKNYSKRPAQICFFDLVDIDIVVSDLTVLDIIESVDKICDGGLACTGGAYKSYLLSGLCMEHNVVKDHLLICVSEINIIKGNITFHGLIGCCIVCLVVMLPCPVSCVMICLDDLSVFLLRVYQHYITVISLSRLIKELKYSVSSGQRHDDGVELHTYLVDGH